MRLIAFTALFIILLAFTGNAQGVYSKESLAKDSLAVLNLHLEKAHKLKKTGVILSIAGPVGFMAGTVVAVASYAGGTEGGFVAGSLLLVGGMITTAVGLPILIIGSTRVNKVKTAINNHQGASLNLAPVFVYNNKNQSLYPGLKLNVRF
jgi:hypothetical protein